MSDQMIPNDSGFSCSPWMRETVPDLWADLPAQIYADVCIVGAGIAGLSVAYHMVRAGRSVVVIDDGPIGGGETGRTSAHLSSALDDRFWWLEQHHGVHGAMLAAQSHSAAIDDIEAIIEREGIDCDFQRVDGFLFTPPNISTDELTRELGAARRAGLEVEMVPRAPLMGFETGPALRFGRQAQFHPIRYLRGLAEAVLLHGGRICTGIRAEHIEGGTPATVRTDGGHTIQAGAIVVATNAPISSRWKLPMKQAAYRTYVVALRVPRATVPTALFWDTGDPYHYARVVPGAGGGDNDMLIVGGEDHRTGGGNHANDRYDRLISWARDRFVGANEVTARWSGQIMEPADGLGLIGHDPSSGEHVYLATGDSGHGLTHGTIAGILLSDLILGRENGWAPLYDPARKSGLRATGKYLKDAAHAVGQYTHWFRGGDVRSSDDIAPGQGAVVRRGLHMLAVYRDHAGHLHERSASCPHLGAVVCWNAAERSWDCPAHGSRFDCLGRVMNGPASSDLSPVEEPAPTDTIPVTASTTFPALDPTR
jgi:glycine/D-amino acid oxidase-like deaminating enzyme/nitrite reductase/ring-hydroxylating ferredoxin subunit